MIPPISRLSYHKALVLGSYVQPVCLLVFFVLRFDVDFSKLDRWRPVRLFYRIPTGKVEFAAFFAQHNSVHWRVFPELLFSALPLASNCRITDDPYCSIGLAIITSWMLCAVAREQTPTGVRGGTSLP